VELVERAVELVGSGLGDESDLTAGGAALGSALAADGDAEFLEGVEGKGEGGGEAGVAGVIAVGALASAGGGDAGALVVVDVDAIEGDVVLVAAGAEDFTGGGDAGLDAEQFDDVAGLEGKLEDLGLVKGLPTVASTVFTVPPSASTLMVSETWPRSSLTSAVRGTLTWRVTRVE
jgi:hypothetical protein